GLALGAARLLGIALGAALGLDQRDGGAGALLAVLGHVLGPPLELLVARGTRLVAGLQQRRQRREVAVGVEAGRLDAGPGQRVVVGALAVVGGVQRHRE